MSRTRLTVTGSPTTSRIQRFFDVYTTFITTRRRRMNVKMTLSAYRIASSSKWYIKETCLYTFSRVLQDFVTMTILAIFTKFWIWRIEYYIIHFIDHCHQMFYYLTIYFLVSTTVPVTWSGPFNNVDPGTVPPVLLKSTVDAYWSPKGL